MNLFTLLFALGCSNDKAGDTAASGDIVGDDGCGVTIDSTYPVSDAADMYYRGTVAVELSDEDATATLSLNDSGGAAVDGAATADGDWLYFAPSSSLAPSTGYTAVITYCGSEDPVEIPFTTSGLGAELSDGAESLVGNTYAVDLSSGNFEEPPGVGDLIGSLLENNILIGITGVTDGLAIRGAISEAGNENQDYCTQSLESFPTADFSENPYFEINATEGIELSVSGMDIAIDSLLLSGTFADDGSYFGGAELAGELDARKLAPLLGELVDSTDPDEICGLLMGFGVSCGECSSDGEAYCINLKVTRLVANETGTEVGMVCGGECHESCADSTCEVAQPADALECDPATWGGEGDGTGDGDGDIAKQLPRFVLDENDGQEDGDRRQRACQ